jgi:alpha-ketoglutarate-dependent taurine dioxygenase
MHPVTCHKTRVMDRSFIARINEVSEDETEAVFDCLYNHAE